MEIPALSISSTECRARVEAGEPVWYLVPDGVVQYIAKRRLYAKAEMTARYETLIRTTNRSREAGKHS